MRQKLELFAALAALISLCACAGAVEPGSGSGSGSGQNGNGATAPSITLQPASQTVAVGQTATFSVTAKGSPAPTYQWQNAATGANISGATSASYAIPAATSGESGSKFQVVVSNSAGSITSTAATLTVDTTPGFSAQPANVTVNAGQQATFTVAATGSAPFSYQWQRGTTNISGATSASYTFTTSAGDNGATFRAVVTNAVGNATSNSATLTVDYAPSITTQPANQTVLVSQTATFSVSATGNPAPAYQWQNAATNANISGATSASYTTPATMIADNGSTFQVVVTNSVGSQTSHAATLTVNSSGPPPTNAKVLTYHNDSMRTGLNPNETILTTSNVKSSTFGKLGSLTVTGLVDAEPLYVPNLTIGGAQHNVVFVVTEHDMAYAFDADTPGSPLWQVSLIPATETPSDDRGCGQVEPEIGITSTPVIDQSAGPNGTMFVVTMSKDSSNNYHQRLHAVDLTTGADRITPTLIQATYPGNGTGSSNGTQTFNPASYEERSALLLANGVIYTTWTSHCDAPNYTSWVIAYSESLAQTSVLNMTANGNTQGGQEGGIWNAGDGPSVDASGNIYFPIGNGTFDTTLDGNGFPNTRDFGNSFVKLSLSGTTLSVADYFAMDNPNGGDAESESSADTDFGSGGAMLLPDLQDGQGNTWHLGVGAGKDGNMYIVNRDNMGKFVANDANIYQELDGALSGGIWSAPAYFNNSVYYGPVGSALLAFKIANAKLATSASSSSPTSFGYPGATPSVSANGTSSGIVWAIENGSSTGVLHAYDATNLATELYNSNQAANNRDQFATNSNCKFVTPMIANGKVYVRTPGAVIVFGLMGQ